MKKVAPDHVKGDYPEWLAPHLKAVFGDKADEEGRALSSRAPLDLRVNALKVLRPRVLELLADLTPAATPLATLGVRIAAREDGRGPSVQSDPVFIKGFIEIQDEGSQLVATLACVDPGMQVLDLCAGAGGKTLALAAAMNNKGQIYATDTDARRLAPIHARLERAGVRNVQVRNPKRKVPQLADLAGKMDVVLIDAPCTGTGTWRRNPDAKWRIRPGSLEQRLKEQAEVLVAAKQFVKPGGRIAYVTCSFLDEENDAQVDAFLAASPDWAVVEQAKVAEKAKLPTLAEHRTRHGILLTPYRTGTDGFYLAMLQKRR